MTDFRNNAVTSGPTRRRTQAPDVTAPLPFGSKTQAVLASPAPAFPAGAREEARSRRKASAQRFAARGARRRSQTGEPARPARPRRGVRQGGSDKAQRRTNFVKYAADNRFVQIAHDLTSGAKAPLFMLLVVAVVGVSLYFPIRDYYTAWRSGEILSKQVELRDAYNDDLQENVDRYLSQEGIEQAARSELGMVLPGETRIELVGNDDASADGDADQQGGSGDTVPSTPAEAELAEAAVADEAPWYIKVLDTVFFFDGVEGQTVTSTGGN